MIYARVTSNIFKVISKSFSKSFFNVISTIFKVIFKVIFWQINREIFDHFSLWFSGQKFWLPSLLLGGILQKFPGNTAKNPPKTKNSLVKLKIPRLDTKFSNLAKSQTCPAKSQTCPAKKFRGWPQMVTVWAKKLQCWPFWLQFEPKKKLNLPWRCVAGHANTFFSRKIQSCRAWKNNQVSLRSLSAENCLWRMNSKNKNQLHWGLSHNYNILTAWPVHNYDLRKVIS